MPTASIVSVTVHSCTPQPTVHLEREKPITLGPARCFTRRLGISRDIGTERQKARITPAGASVL